MAMYIARRLLQAIIAILVILTVLFFLLRASGDPALLLAGPDPTAPVINAINHQLGLDQPLLTQYITYLSGVAHLNFGNSYLFDKTSLPIVAGVLPVSLLLVVVAQAIAIVLAFIIGTWAAVRRSGTSRSVMVVAFFGQAVPFFWLALLLVLLFALKLGWFPATGSPSTYGWSTIVLPVAALAIPNVATLSRLVRSQVIDVLAQPYVVTAVSKGLRFRRVLFRHVLPNAISPLISYIAIQFSFLLGSLIILKSIFNYQGIGILLINAVQGKDYAIVQAGVFLISSLVIGANLLADVANRLIDPRLRQSAVR